MQKIAIDTNIHFYGPTRPTISPFVISRFNLQSGDKIIGFQDSQEWEGVVGFDNSFPDEMQWYLDISNGNEFSVSIEREEGRDEGWSAALPIGELLGEISVVTEMLKDGLDLETIKKYTRLSHSRLENIKCRMKESE
jgi:hypothetical protein